MSPKSLTLGAAFAAIAVPVVGASPAAADVPLVTDSSAQNVTAYGATAAWSRQAPDGYRLVVVHEGRMVDAPVPASPTPYDPDLGPTGANGRTVVYARGGDLYRYDVGAAAEQRLDRLSTGAREAAPSFFKDKIAFSRTSDTREGVYLARPGRRVTRVLRTVAAETDIADTRIIGRFGKGRRSIVRILNHGADDVRIVARARSGQRMASPTLSRFNGFWLRVGATRSTVEQTGVNLHRTLQIRVADRALSGQVGSLASFKIPTLYTTQGGVRGIDPKLRFDR